MVGCRDVDETTDTVKVISHFDCGMYAQYDVFSYHQDNTDSSWYYKFVITNVVGDNVLFTAAMLPVGNADNHDPVTYSGEDISY